MKHPFLRFLRGLFVNNLYLKAIAAILTVALYIWVSEDRETIVSDTAPVRIVVPDDMILVSDPPDRVRITIRGRWSDVQRFDFTQVEPIRIDLSRTDRDRMVNITSDMVRVPPGIRVTNIDPPAIHVLLEPEAFKDVLVTPAVSGEPNPAYTVTDTTVTPNRITLRGPESRLERISSVSTEPVDITGRTRPLRRNVRVETGDARVNAEITEPLVLEVEIETQEVSHTFSDIPVSAVNTGLRVDIEPPTTDVTLRGPKPLIDDLDAGMLRAEIDLGDLDDPSAATYSREAEIVNVPPELDVARVFPQRFRVTIAVPDP